MTDLDSALTDLDEGEFPDESLEDDFIGDGARAVAALSDLVLYSLDWSVQSIIERIGGSIDLEPPFQRRDAWTIERKSRYIESLVMDLPVPQIVLAEDSKYKGRFVVLDGKQKLLTLKEFAAPDGVY